MFGHNDDDDDNNKTDQPADDPNAMPNVVPDPSVTASLVNPTAPVVNTGSGAPSSVPSAPSVPPVPDASEEMTNDTNPLGDSADTSAPADTPDDSSQTSPTNTDDSVSSNDDVVTKGDASDEEPTQSEETSEPETTKPADDELISLKQQALEQLSPLVDHLDQTPEEKFRTTMMMIQASDNSSLVKTAYEAAQAITDDKVRAQALLDVINEINYFTQNKTNEEDS